MSETPKKIYLHGFDNDFSAFWYHEKMLPDMTKYIRADLVVRLREACEALIAAKLQENDHYDEIWAEDRVFAAWELAKAALETGKVDG